MTDRAPQAVVPGHTGAAALRRLRRRYRSEFMFRALGGGAVLLAGGFLAAFLATILVTALPAFTQHDVRLEIALPAPEFNPAGAGSEALARAVDAGNVDAVILAALRARLSDPGDPADYRALGEIISAGAAAQLRRQVLADPTMIGARRIVALPLEATADLYLKGLVTERETAAGRGTLALAGGPREVRLTAAGADFAAARLAARQGLPTREVPSFLIAVHGGLIRLKAIDGATATGDIIIAPRSLAPAPAGTWQIVRLAVPEAGRRLGDNAIGHLDQLQAQGLVERRFAWELLAGGDSREPELAGIGVAMIGSVLTLLVTFLVSFPIGVAAAVHLEEFAPRSRLTDLIEVPIGNLAAVPPIIFGLLGVAIFLNMFGLPRAAPLVAGLVLALMTLPVIIIAARAALRAVPGSVKEAALGLGASHQQAVFHHVLPQAMPGILTGAILGMAQALGETAPLLMLGMVAFVVDPPSGLTDAATTLPVQIFMWAGFPEPAFRHKTAAAVLALLVVLVVMNALAVFLRRRFERRW